MLTWIIIRASTPSYTCSTWGYSSPWFSAATRSQCYLEPSPSGRPWSPQKHRGLSVKNGDSPDCFPFTQHLKRTPNFSLLQLQSSVQSFSLLSTFCVMTSSWGKELRGWVWGEGLFFSGKPNCRMQHILSLAAFHTSPRGSWRAQAGVRRYQLTSTLPEHIFAHTQWHTACTTADLRGPKEVLGWQLREYLVSSERCYKAEYLTNE